MELRHSVLCLFAVSSLSGSAIAADLPGSHDPQNLKRFQGSQIINFVTRKFDQYAFALGPGTPGGGFTKSETMEGQITRAIYHVPSGHTALEVLRNYENMLTGLGLKQSYELTPCGGQNWSGYFVDRFYGQGGPTDNTPFHSISNSCYAYAKGTKDGKQIGVAVLVAEMSSDFNFHPTGTTQTIPLKNGDVLVAVDEVAAAPVGNSMK